MPSLFQEGALLQPTDQARLQWNESLQYKLLLLLRYGHPRHTALAFLKPLIIPHLIFSREPKRLVTVKHVLLFSSRHVLQHHWAWTLALNKQSVLNNHLSRSMPYHVSMECIKSEISRGEKKMECLFIARGGCVDYSVHPIVVV